MGVGWGIGATGVGGSLSGASAVGGFTCRMLWEIGWWTGAGGGGWGGRWLNFITYLSGDNSWEEKCGFGVTGGGGGGSTGAG